MIDLHEYDIASGTWVDLSSAGNPPNRFFDNRELDATNVAQSNGKLFVLRGHTGHYEDNYCGMVATPTDVLFEWLSRLAPPLLCVVYSAS